MIDKLFLTLVLFIGGVWSCGEIKFAGQPIKAEVTIKIPETDTNPFTPPPSKQVSKPLDSKSTGIGEATCSEMPELCPKNDESCPVGTFETFDSTGAKKCMTKNMCAINSSACLCPFESQIFNEITLKCESNPPSILVCAPQKILDTTGSCVTSAKVCNPGTVLNTSTNSCDNVCKGGSTWVVDKCVCPSDKIWDAVSQVCKIPICAEEFILDATLKVCKSRCATPQVWNKSNQICESPQSVPPITTCPDDWSKCTKLQDFFSPDSTKPGAVDIVWVVDSSGSMSNKMSRVQNNLSRFMSNIYGYSKPKVALITQTFDLPTVPGVPTVNIRAIVNSTTPIIAAAAASCPAENYFPLGADQQGNICGEWVNWRNVYHWGPGQSTYEPAQYNLADVAGCLYNGRYEPGGRYKCPLAPGTPFFRPDTKRVYVFVTDDDSVNYSSSSFIKGVKRYMNGGDAAVAACDVTKTCNIPLVFVFGATERSQAECGATIASSAYVNAVNWTGGSYTRDSISHPFFNVCRDDWTPYFDHMLAEIKGSVLDTLTVSKSIVSGSLSVRVLRTYYGNKLVEDGTKRTLVTDTDTTKNRLLVEGKDYTLEGNQIVLREGAIQMVPKANSWGDIVRAFYLSQP